MESFDFVNQANAEYIDQLHQQYQKDPRSIPEAWRSFFAGFEIGLKRSESPTAPKIEPTPTLALGVFDLVHSYRELGHFCAKLDPLNHDRPAHPLLDVANFGMRPIDLDREVGNGGFAGTTDGTLRDLVKQLRQTYCQTIGVEFINISDQKQRTWLQQRMEPILNRPELSEEQTEGLMYQLIAAEEFELYLGRAFIGSKRFGIEGAEALIPLLNSIIDEGSTFGGDQFLMNMAHRGRLNVLAHVLNKPYETIVAEFEGTSLVPDEVGGDGDVKYHLGYACRRPVASGEAKISLVPNPSHLELVNPIMQGIVRCKQSIFGDTGRNRVVPISMHGDAAFTGQGIVAETLNLSEMPGWRTGGTIHIIVNNQIGFTTPPRQGRFTPYPTDMAKAIQAPIFHVNGDDPEAVIWAGKLAVAFRQEFKCDVLIDLWCYRRNGHNEQDEPSFTQPLMYREIAEHKTVRQLYAEKLLAENRVTQEDLDEMKKTVIDRLNQARERAHTVKPRAKVPSFGGVWRGFGRAPADTSQWNTRTAVSRNTLSKVAGTLRNLPEGFTVHPKLQRQLVDRRVEMVESGKGIDWGCAEMLAFGSLLLEGYGVRLTGQDVERGTFSHRHAVLHDYQTGEQYYPLSHLVPGQGKYTVMNSILSEMAVLGFEWGYASADPRNLVVWEAQFGDFVNGAQPIIDQILVSAESKWRFHNGLVMLLPHGYEGQGPEHSQGYLERFLDLCAEGNMQVIVPSTPAQYFHALRRQIHRKFRKPMVAMMPKSVLRDPTKASNIEEFADGSFQNVIDDPNATDGDKIRRVLLCSGKVYFALQEACQKDKERTAHVAILRVEQLYPFPQRELETILRRYGRKQEVCWVQEEPKNRGAWSYIEPCLRAMLPDTILSYHGRDAAASPATGSLKEHQAEEKQLIASALELPVNAASVVEATKPGTAATSNSAVPVSK